MASMPLGLVCVSSASGSWSNTQHPDPTLLEVREPLNNEKGLFLTQLINDNKNKRNLSFNSIIL